MSAKKTNIDSEKNMNSMSDQMLGSTLDEILDYIESQGVTSELAKVYKNSVDTITEAAIRMMRESLEPATVQYLSRKAHKVAGRLDEKYSSFETVEAYYGGMLYATLQYCTFVMTKRSGEQYFAKNIEVMIERKHVREILSYLYHHPYVQNKRLCEYCMVKPNILNKTANAMERNDLIEITRFGKYTYYELTDQCRKYFDDHAALLDDDEKKPNTINVFITSDSMKGWGMSESDKNDSIYDQTTMERQIIDAYNVRLHPDLFRTDYSHTEASFFPNMNFAESNSAKANIVESSYAELALPKEVPLLRRVETLQAADFQPTSWRNKK